MDVYWNIWSLLGLKLQCEDLLYDCYVNEGTERREDLLYAVM